MSTTQLSKYLSNSSKNSQKGKNRSSSQIETAQYSLLIDEQVIPLSENEGESIIDMLTALRQGKSYTVVSDETDMTTQQAAEVLNVSRPYFVKLLKNKEIPFYKVGNRRRVLAKDVFSYKQKRDGERRQVLQEFSDGIYEDGLYDLEYELVQEILNDD